MQQLHNIDDPNTPFTIAEQIRFEVIQGTIKKDCVGSAFVKWLPFPRIVIDGQSNENVSDLKLEKAIIRTDQFGDIAARILSLFVGGEHKDSLTMGVKVVSIKSDKSIISLKYFLINCPEYKGLKSLESTIWKLNIVQAMNPRLQENLENIGGYGLTHIITVQKQHGDPIEAVEVDQLRTTLYYFFSFCAGRWVAPFN